MNKIYRIIWNSTLGLWVVASELTRGKTKSVTSTSLSGMILAALLSPSVFASSCDDTSLTCELGTTWSSATNNYGTDTVTVSDGQTYAVKGPDEFKVAPGTYKIYTSINQLINAGYITADPIPVTDTKINKGLLSKIITVYDPITNSNKTVAVYNSMIMGEWNSGYAQGGIGVMSSGPADVYAQSRFVNVTDGVANIDAGTQAIRGGMRNTQFVYADGTNSTKAEANWLSKNEVSFSSEVDFLAQPTQTYAAQKDTYKGTFSTFDNGSYTVNSLADFQNYNNWLISQLESQALNYSQYASELAKAYTSTTTNYVINNIPADADTTILNEAPGKIALLYGKGANATVRLAASGQITGDTRGSRGNSSVFRLENGATGINEGEVEVSHYTAIVESGSTFINKSRITSGSNTFEGFGIHASGVGSRFINDAVLNLRPAYWSANYNGTNYAVTLNDGAEGINNHVINIGITEGNKGRNALGNVHGVRVNTASQFTNANGANINLGLAENGDHIYVKSGSYGINATGTTHVDNQGTITLSDKVEGSSAIYATNTTSSGVVVNRGKIVITSNGDNGNFIPETNVAIQAVNNSKGVYNIGSIDIIGINTVGIKTLTGGQVVSSGDINIIGGADLLTGLRNYGAWSEGANSLVNISGTVNMNGDRAIGLHARNSGSIAIDGAGEVKFVSGTDQIGFFVYGPSASLTNTGSGAMNVSTERSTLFRMEDGADFTGGTGASSSLTASGKDSTAVMVTGLTGTDVSAFNSGGMTLNLSGENATGVLVEGGAQGNIAAIANINLIGVGAIAGIADGQKHDLTGSATGTPVAGVLTNGTLNAGAAGFGTGTLLVAGANLNSSLDSVTGYIARNSATLSNSGNIIFSGKNTTGIQVLDGSVGGNTGSITLQDGGIGLIASSSNLATTINNSGNLVLKGGTNANRTKGIQASGSAVTVNMTGGSIDMQGQGAVGVEAMDGGKVILSGTALPTFAAEATGVTDQIAFRIVGNGASIQTNLAAGTVLDASGKQSTLFRIEDGATQSGVLQMQTSGNDANGIWATGAGTTVVASSGSDFQILGAGAKGVYITGAAKGTLKSGTTVSLVGDGAVVGVVDGNEYDLAGNILTSNTGSTLTNESNITSTLNNAIGFITQNQGLLVNQGNIDFTLGTGNTGVKVINGQFENKSSNINVNGVAVSVEGAGSVVTSTGGNIVATNGEAAIKLGQDASLNLVGSGLGTVEGQGTAHGVLLDTGAKGLIIAGAKINVNAAGATGNGVENKAEIAGLQLTGTTQINVANGKGIRTAATLAQTNSGTINVNGSGTGLAFETATGGVVANIATLDMSDSTALVINLNGVGGTGILANTADDATVKSGASVNVAQANGGSALVVNNSAASVIQSGNLNSSSTTAAVVRAEKAKNFTNTGKIIANSVTAEAMSFDGSINTVVLNDTGAAIQGVIAMNGGNNNVTNKGLITGTLTAADGNNQMLFETGSTLTGSATLGQGNNQVTLNGTAHTD
uniref:ESPR domain-containing protein n=1 Tax=Budvicia diplopodorum TaxID=1119056 RepID=UPI002483E48D